MGRRGGVAGLPFQKVRTYNRQLARKLEIALKKNSKQLKIQENKTCISIYIYIYICIIIMKMITYTKNIYVYIYIYIERERGSETYR